MARKFLITALLITQTCLAFAQTDSGFVVIPISKISTYKSFVYRKITQEYITNENGYFIDVKNDTTYVIFKQTSEPLVYDIITRGDEAGIKAAPRNDTLHRIKLTVAFNADGSVKELRNWKTFRDFLVSFYSAQVAAAKISSSEFDEMKDRANNEENIRRMMMEDLQYVFSLCGDTFNSSLEYLRVKAVRSPFSGNEMYIEGNLRISKPPGTRNTIMFDAQNLAGPVEKKVLMEEVTDYVNKTAVNGQTPGEITAVGLNSEQQFQYNPAQQHIIQVRLSDVVVIGNSSRGNVRTYYLWDIKK